MGEMESRLHEVQDSQIKHHYAGFSVFGRHALTVHIYIYIYIYVEKSVIAGMQTPSIR